MPSSTPAAASGPSARPAGPALLEVRSLTTAYRGLIAISDISIDVHPGEIVAVAGANGAGKSTLLKTVAGLERARSGTVTFAGERIDTEPGHLITARGLAYVPENRRLFPACPWPTICAWAATFTGARRTAKRRWNRCSAFSRA
jgi:ABC-type branched-subunit amino acid transport system ATPase component